MTVVPAPVTLTKQTDSSPFRFAEVSRESGIDFVHFSGMTEDKYFPTAAAVLRNDTPTKNHWVRLVLQGTRSNRDAVGTRVEVDTGEPVIYRQRKGGVSMESANDPRLSIGVGAVRVLKKNKIRWPSGIVTTREDLKVDQEYKIVESKDGAAGPAHPAPAAPPGGPGVLSQ
jgi:hypothetical protein